MKLYRPHIPLSVRVKVAERQFMQLCPDKAGHLVGKPHSSGNRLKALLPLLADAFGCEVSELRLDHELALALRKVVIRRPYLRGEIWVYEPDANDPEYLVYRPHGAQHAGSHDVKTRIRGEHGQFSDIAMIKRQRRRERPAKRKAKIPSRPFQKRKK
jgi:hypothetical protein